MLSKFIFLLSTLTVTWACSDFYMNFTQNGIRLSARTMDLGLETTNWTITSWPRQSSIDFASPPPMSLEQMQKGVEVKYGMVGITANWLGDEHWGFPSFFADSINDQGLSCSLLTLVNSKFEHYSERKTNVFVGSFCKWAVSQHATVLEVKAALDSIAIFGPDIVAEHFIMRDANGMSLVVEMIDGKKQVYLDLNDAKTGFGVTTNEPTFDWHLKNIEHYEWKRGLARQSVAVPGNWYPEERFLRVHMVKSGLQKMMNSVTDLNQAIALTAQVLNVVSVPQGEQYGTDTGDSSGEGSSNDHTVFAVIRDHADPAFYWRDNTNPTFRRVRLADLNLTPNGHHRTLKLESGPLYVDLTHIMK